MRSEVTGRRFEEARHAALTITPADNPAVTGAAATAGPDTARFETEPGAAVPDASHPFNQAFREAFNASPADPGPTADRAVPRTTAATPAGRQFDQAFLGAAEPAATGSSETLAAADPADPASPAARQFIEGMRRGLDPANAGVLGAARTTGHSDWCIDVCQICRHSFRPGDQVWLAAGPDGQVTAVHDIPELPCRTGCEPPDPQPPVRSVAIQAFDEAANRADTGFPGLRVVRLRPGHPLLSGQYLERKRCAGCNHTFRPYDFVAYCPCNWPEPACKLAAHRDPTASLLCFDALADPDRRHCPMNYRKLKHAGVRR